LGFTTLSWFILSSFQGFTTNKHAKLFHGKRKAKDFHCIGALITNIILGFHVLFLFISEPWRSVALAKNIEHYPYNLFLIKIWTGIIFAFIMIFVSILSFYLRDMKKLKKFGYKRFILVHRIMLILTIILVIHIFLINTELWIAGILSGEIDD
jgi:predicted ferric reductase